MTRMTTDEAWRELEADALASDGRITDSDVKNAIRRNRGRIEAAVRNGLADDQMAAFIAGFRTRHEWPDEPIDLFTLTLGVHASRSLLHKADVTAERCGSCRDEALSILIALGIPSRRSSASEATR